MLTMICVLLLPFLFLMGKAAIKILYRSGKGDALFWEDEILTGVVLLIGLAEAAHLGAMACGRSVSAAVKLFVLLAAGMALVCAAVTVVCRLKKGKNRERSAGPENWRGRRPAFSGKEIPVLVCLCILTAILFYRVLAGLSVYLDGDLTLETVITFLKTDRLYEINPLTGSPYREGVPSRIRILCLPALYAVLCRLSSVPAQLLVWKLVPAFVLLASLLAYRCLAKSLFPDQRLHRELFLAFVLLLFLLGDEMYGLEGFGLFYAGFQGTTIRNAVLLPYLFSLCVRKKWKLAPGPVLAEACIVWTLYGLGACAAVGGIFGAAEIVRRIRAGRKESKCGNS